MNAPTHTYTENIKQSNSFKYEENIFLEDGSTSARNILPKLITPSTFVKAHEKYTLTN